MSQEPATTSPCHKCGVAVPLGYVRCPRCHAPMATSPRARRESMREAIAGGTAVTEPDGGGFPWLLAIVCAVAATAAVVWYVTSGGARSNGASSASAASAAPASPASIDPPTGAPLASASAPASGDVEPPPAPKVDPRPQQRTEAMAALARVLDADKLWASVAETGDTVEIRSSFCADKGVAARVDAVRAHLAELGFHGVRCLEQGGTPVWKRDLP